MSLDPNKTYLVWSGTEFPNSTYANFRAPAGSTIDWGDGTVETFTTASTSVNTHTYTDGQTEHTIVISGLTNIYYNAFNRCNGLTSMTISNSVTVINDHAFENCDNLTSITIPNSVTDIRFSAFFSCSSLTSITIPEGITYIASRLFYWCSSLTNVIIPESVKTIYDDAFTNCVNLKQLILLPSTPPTLSSDAIPRRIQSIYVPQSSKEAYQTATNWNAYASKIVSDNIYMSFARFNQKNKEYIDKKINDNFNELSLENGTADVLVQTTDSNHSFKVMSDGRAKVQSAPVEDDDVVRLSEVSPILSDYVDDALLGG